MNKRMLLVLCLISIFVYDTSVNAEPLKVEEKGSDNMKVNFKPLYASISGEFEVVTKKIDGSFVIFYLSDTDPVLSLYESYYHGQEINQSDSTELIIKNGVKYHYSPFRNNHGGTLTWVKNNILIEMSSSHFNKNTMMQYASTIK
ncbi:MULTISPECIES: hypothetical protein [Paenibacillus]|uniref:hypothetical protein n=1 Tax=Paenibacillus TaxID=44249 RepID=UPI001F35B914|nr:hypothetical protein [Paenibacillus sp. JJ-223]CAH1199647.1 hypothetical protein PAECIP111890_01716 [Paenibacillus sp. JJ-223]